ncbi:hypothetical protein GOB80_11105 [Acetobacter ghanensis]|uniref:Anti-sigma factor NepR domain-containing protein n=3 Tax=Acetobacter TaxID=434 RepID=A0ABX0KPP4_9PROT|nr:hypothetical protein [Acetobacter ghanensis]GBQ48329.1 hypothetical protein AA18895_1313 [Acetobacter ghanensis DSM 18895]
MAHAELARCRYDGDELPVPHVAASGNQRQDHQFGMGKSMDGAPPRKGRQSRDQAFDVWLKRGLHQLFDDVVNEPVPEELLKLIEEDRSKQD